MLDRFEGVPWAYEKLLLEIDLKRRPMRSLPSSSTKVGYTTGWQGSTGLEKVMATAYVDLARVRDDQPKKEYVQRMRKAVIEGAKEGVPRDWLREQIGSKVDLGDVLD